MKVRSSVRKMCDKCRIIKRRGVVRVIWPECLAVDRRCSFEHRAYSVVLAQSPQDLPEITQGARQVGMVWTQNLFLDGKGALEVGKGIMVISCFA